MPSSRLLHAAVPLRFIRVRPRLTLSLVCAVLVYGLLTPLIAHHAATRLLLAYDCGTTLYLILAGVMMLRSQPASIHHRALLQDDGKIVVLIGVVLVAITSLLAIAAQLSAAKDMHDLTKLCHIGLAVMTIVLSWAFTQVMFALHYAHDYFTATHLGQDGGLDFPGDGEPTYLDFLYLSAIIGTSGQTADVSFTSSAMRRVGLVHCVLAFFFNATLLALTINIAAGLM